MQCRASRSMAMAAIALLAGCAGGAGSSAGLSATATAPPAFVAAWCRAIADLAGTAPAYQAIATDLASEDQATIMLDAIAANAATSLVESDLDRVPLWDPAATTVSTLIGALTQTQTAVAKAATAIPTQDATAIADASAALSAAEAQLARAGDDVTALSAAYPLACSVATLAAQVPTPTPVDAGGAYLALAAEADARFRNLGLPQVGTYWVGTPDQEASARTSILGIEEAAAIELAAVDWPPAARSKAQTLVAAVSAAQAALQAGTDIGIVSTTELEAQVMAAQALRQALGVAALDVSRDLL